MTNDDLARVVTLVCASWRNLGELDDADRLVARRQLGDLDRDAVVAAVDVLAREREWFPGWGMLAAKAVEMSNPVGDESEALAEVQRAFSTIGRYGRPVWSSPAVAETVAALGGWSRCCDMAAEHFPRQFSALYARCAGRARRDALMPPSARALVAATAAGLRLEPASKNRALPPATSTASVSDTEVVDQ